MPAGIELYKTKKLLKRTLRVAYPPGNGDLVLRTELDWGRDIHPTKVSADKTISTFEVKANHPFLYFKPVLCRGGEQFWAKGDNQLLLMTEDDRRVCYPFFFSPEQGRISKLLTFPSKILGREHRVRVFLPPGYDENTLAEYPVAFVQDGQNLFFPEEAFMGQDWHFDSTHMQLRSMGAVDDAILVGIYSGDRMEEYTKPGYELYGRSLVEEIVPECDKRLRSRADRRYRAVWGSSLGGVVSFYCAWHHPETFGAAICMSSTFSFKDDLLERVLTENPVPDVGFYLDSGWPGDNYETTLGMTMALISRGWRLGQRLMHFAFPMAQHSEVDWGLRLHVPLQLLNGSVARYSRLKSPALGDAPRVMVTS